MPSSAKTLIDIEHRRLRSLVLADRAGLDAIHAPEFVLVHPSGGVWSKEQYIGGIVSRRITYRRFEPVTEMEILVDGDLGVLRYRSLIDIHIQGQEPGELECWHMDCYRRPNGEAPWQVVWSQATAIDV